MGCSADNGHRVDGRFGARSDAQEEARRARGCGPTRRARSRRSRRGLAHAGRGGACCAHGEEGSEGRRQLASGRGRPADRGGRAGQATLRRARSGGTPRRRSTACRPARPATTRATSRSRSSTWRRPSTSSSSYQGAYSIFSEIADKPNHLKYNETLLWLAKLATDLPEPADIIERVGKYNEEQVAKFNNNEQQELYWQLNYLLGRYKYRNGQFHEALGALREGRPAQQVLRAGAVLRRHLERPAAPEQAGGRGVPAHPRRHRRGRRRGRGRGAHARPRVPVDGAHLLLGERHARRDHERADRRPDALSAPPSSTGTRSTSASEYWLDALFEESWAYFMAGDYSHALGNIHTIEAPYFPHAYYPEADVLKAVIYFANCQYDDALTIVAKFRGQLRADPRRAREDPRQVQGRRTRKKSSTSS